METYIFILGNNKELSRAEIGAVFGVDNIDSSNDVYVSLESDDFDCVQAQRRLGGTIKIAQVIGAPLNAQTIAKNLLESSLEGKIIFGISNYAPFLGRKLPFDVFKLGLEVKKILKSQGRSARLVTSKEKVLSSVVVEKNNCQEYIILHNDLFARTCAVQEFEEYGERDFGRPARDAKSGMLPPKLAKMMINLAEIKPQDTLLDPFCGSGTILQEALLLGATKVIGSDSSPKAFEDTGKNLVWLKEKYQIQETQYQILQCDARQISQRLKSPIDVIVTEPYLGPALSGHETREKISGIVRELSDLYISALRELKKVLKPNGMIVIVIPSFRFQNMVIRLSLIQEIEKIGYQIQNTESLFYSRSDQKLIREIVILKKV